MTRQAYVLPEHELAIFWTPKAACTSIVQQICFSILGMPRGSLKNEPGRARGWLARNSYGKDGHSARSLCEDEGYTSIGLIRDPYERLTSAYLNKFVRNHRGPLLAVDELEPFAREFYEHDFAPTGEYEGLSFRQFVEAVCTAIDERDGREPRLNHHWNTQIPFSFHADGFTYDYLYSLDSSAAFFKTLATLTGTPVENQVANASVYGPPAETSLVDHRSVELAEHDSLSKDSFRDDGLAELVARSFAVDYDYLLQALPETVAHIEP